MYCRDNPSRSTHFLIRSFGYYHQIMFVTIVFLFCTSTLLSHLHASSPRSAEDFYSDCPHVFIARQVSVIIKGLSCVVLSGYLQSGVSKQRARAKLSKQRVLARVLKRLTCSTARDSRRSRASNGRR